MLNCIRKIISMTLAALFLSLPMSTIVLANAPQAKPLVQQEVKQDKHEVKQDKKEVKHEVKANDVKPAQKEAKHEEKAPK